jgi:hypothetical protein
MKEESRWIEILEWYRLMVKYWAKEGGINRIRLRLRLRKTSQTGLNNFFAIPHSLPAGRQAHSAIRNSLSPVFFPLQVLPVRKIQPV